MVIHSGLRPASWWRPWPARSRRIVSAAGPCPTALGPEGRAPELQPVSVAGTGTAHRSGLGPSCSGSSAPMACAPAVSEQVKQNHLSVLLAWPWAEMALGAGQSLSGSPDGIL